MPMQRMRGEISASSVNSCVAYRCPIEFPVNQASRPVTAIGAQLLSCTQRPSR